MRMVHYPVKQENRPLDSYLLPYESHIHGREVIYESSGYCQEQ
jgi:hypothetical protein